MRCDLGHEEDRHFLSPFRAEVWRGSLTAKDFNYREQCLYDHSFGQTKIATYVWRGEEGLPLSAMDVLTVPFLVKAGDKLEEQVGHLIASVVTPPDQRKRGYCYALLNAFLNQHGSFPTVLYSEVGAPFYERLGFSLFPSTEVEREAVPIKDTMAVAITQQKLIHHLREIRQQRLQQSPDFRSLVVFPDIEFLDWRIERYRAISRMRGITLPTQLYWQGFKNEEPFYVAAAPDYSEGRVECLWYAGEEKSVCEWLSDLSLRWGLKRFSFWTSENRPGKKELAMVRGANGKSSGPLIESQLCDWW